MAKSFPDKIHREHSLKARQRAYHAMPYGYGRDMGKRQKPDYVEIARRALTSIGEEVTDDPIAQIRQIVEDEIRGPQWFQKGGSLRAAVAPELKARIEEISKKRHIRVADILQELIEHAVANSDILERYEIKLPSYGDLDHNVMRDLLG